MALPGNKNFSDYDNYITDQNPTTSAQAQDYFSNQAELLKAVIDCDFWQPETVYQPGDVVKSDSMPNGAEAVMVATKASVTSNVEPQWGAVGGANVSDGACFWKLRWKAVTVNGIEADNKGNIQIPVMQGSDSNNSGADGLVPAPPKSADELFLSNGGEWKEAGKVKSVNGKTGDVVVDVLPIGAIIPHSGNTVPTGFLTCNGAAVSRTTYADLFAVIGTTYGAGNGSTTFNLPNLNNNSFLEGSDTVGTIKSAGLPNITGQMYGNTLNPDATNAGQYVGGSGAFTGTIKSEGEGAAVNGSWHIAINTFDASKSNAIYGGSATVQPKSVTVKYIIKAFSTITNEGNIDVENLASDYERVNAELAKVDGISDYIIESYRNGTEWYEVYKSGKVRQGGEVSGASNVITFLKPFANTNYSIGAFQSVATAGDTSHAVMLRSDKKTTGMTIKLGQFQAPSYSSDLYTIIWTAEGQGA